MSNNELKAVIESLEKERGISRASLLQMVEAAILSASRKSIAPAGELRIEVDPKTFAIRAFSQLKVVETAGAAEEIELRKARKIKPDAAPGEVIEVEVTPKNLGRIAAQAAKQAIIQKIRQAEREIVLSEYKDRVGDIVGGTVLRLERGDLIVDLGRVEAIMPASERVFSEDYQSGDRIRAYLLSMQQHISGRHIVLSRAHPNFVRRLFELEVSEIADKTVEIKSIAREPGARTKIAVWSNDEKVDPVGACVGMRGMRVKNIVRELMGEKIDIIRWTEDIKGFIANSLAPAKLKKVEIDEAERKATIIVDSDQLSLAIGKRGQNARLTSKLVGWKIDVIKDMEEASFEEKVSMAIKTLTELEGVDAAAAEKLVHAGFLSAEGIAEASPQDLTDGCGFDNATAKAVWESAIRHANRIRDV